MSETIAVLWRGRPDATAVAQATPTIAWLALTIAYASRPGTSSSRCAELRVMIATIATPFAGLRQKSAEKSLGGTETGSHPLIFTRSTVRGFSPNDVCRRTDSLRAHRATSLPSDRVGDLGGSATLPARSCTPVPSLSLLLEKDNKWRFASPLRGPRFGGAFTEASVRLCLRQLRCRPDGLIRRPELTGETRSPFGWVRVKPGPISFVVV